MRNPARDGRGRGSGLTQATEDPKGGNINQRGEPRRQALKGGGYGTFKISMGSLNSGVTDGVLGDEEGA